jgi:REP element-mobilizing transposase RayT
MALNRYGRIAHDRWLRSADVRVELRLDGFVVMPNHIHGIVFIDAPKGKGDPPVARCSLSKRFSTI